ncbi:MAG: phosphotransferase [Burkholderiaceae bacterium]
MTRKKGIALFPGAFKPAHRQHLQSIDHLCACPEIDEVRVIVSNRARLLPGTNLCLDGRAGVDSLRYLLKFHPPKKPVTVELAKHRAIDQAFNFINKAPPDSTLWFCVGRDDIVNGDQRFHALPAYPHPSSMALKSMVLPSSSPIIHATQLRAMLTQERYCSAIAKFLPTIPMAESDAAAYNYWSLLRSSVSPIAEVVESKLRKLLLDSEFAGYESLSVIKPDSIDPDFHLVTATGAKFKASYAGDTVVTGIFDLPGHPLPARRLAVQARLLRHLSRLQVDKRWVADRVVYWDKSHRLLILEEAPGSPLSSTIRAESSSKESLDIIELAAVFLADFHALRSINEPLWGNEASEHAHWIERVRIAPNAKLDKLLIPKKGLVHLNFSPDTIKVSGNLVGLSGFDRCGVFGDPAWDIATFLRACRREHSDHILANQFISAYRRAWNTDRSIDNDPTRCERAILIAELLA